MRAGPRNKLVTIERSTDTRGDYGEVTESWATLSTAWANIKPMQGGETIQGGQVDATVTHVITLRKTDITADDRINHDNRIFNITRVLNPEERGADQVILAIENV